MAETQSLPDYHTFNKTLTANHFPLTAANCHGLIAGIICLTDDIDSTLTSLLSSEAEQQLDNNVLNMILEPLCRITAAQLADHHFSFQLLLPNDEDNLMQRSLAISAWCQSFISGLGESGIKFSSAYTQELQEIITDLIAISQVDTQIIEETEAEETSFTELVEYVRIGAITIYTDLRLESKNIIMQDAPQQIH